MGKVKITRERYLKIYKALGSMSQAAVAKRFHISRRTVGRIKSAGQRYAAYRSAIKLEKMSLEQYLDIPMIEPSPNLLLHKANILQTLMRKVFRR